MVLGIWISIFLRIRLYAYDFKIIRHILMKFDMVITSGLTYRMILSDETKLLLVARG